MWKSFKNFIGVEEKDLEAKDAPAEAETTYQNEEQKKGLFAQLKDMIGKDITSMISLPVWVFEPTSFLQVMAEPLQFFDLLEKTATSEVSYERLQYLIAWNVALYSQASRIKKPFNPLLGETFELLEEGKYKFIAEQVSHHPPITVGHIEAENFRCILETSVSSKFNGNSGEVTIKGVPHFFGNKFNDRITWSHIKTCANNIIIGTMWIDHYGQLSVTNHTTKDKAEVTFKESGFLGGGRYEFDGKIFDADGKARIRIFGKWNDSCQSQKINDDGSLAEPVTLWKNERSELKYEDNHYKWTEFLFEKINKRDEVYEKTLPLTDSRLRADRRALQDRNNDLAGKKKIELEEAQRARKRAREAKKEEWVPVYFAQVEDEIAGRRYEPIGNKYWDERQARLAALNSADNPAVPERPPEGETIVTED